MNDLSYEFQVAMAEVPKVHPKDIPEHIGFVAETCLDEILEFVVNGGDREELVKTLCETADLIAAHDGRERAARLS